MPQQRTDLTKLVLLFLSLILIALLVYYPHYNYSYPLHIDEWHHIYEAKKLSLGDYDFTSSTTFEFGYHLFLAMLSKIGFNLVLIYRFLPAIFAVAAALILFFFVYYLTGSFFASLFSSLFFASLPTNVNLLGLWFAIPLTLAIPLIYLSIFLFHKGFNKLNPKLILLSYASFFVLLFVHPVSAFFVFFILIIFLALNYKEKEKFRKTWKILILMPLTIVIFIVALMIMMSKNFSWFFSHLLFRHGWTTLEPGVMSNAYVFNLLGMKLIVSPYFLPVLFGVIPFIFSLIGLYFSFREKRLRIFAIWFFYCLVMLFLFVSFKFSLFAPYQRMLYYALLCLAPLAGIGLSKSVGLISRYKKKGIAAFLILILIVLVFFATFYNYGKQPRGMELYYLISEDDYKAGKFLLEQEEGKILAVPKLGSALPTLTGNEVVASLYFFGNEEMRKDSNDFFIFDCDGKEEIIKKYKIKYIYSKSRIECQDIEEIYSDKVYIYKVAL